MKHEKIGIKWKIFFYLLGFTACLLAILWFVQTVYLGVFYKKIKTSELDNAMNYVEAALKGDSISDDISDIAANYDICILIASEQGDTLYSAETSVDCFIHKFSAMEIKKYYYQAIGNGGELVISDEKESKPSILNNRFNNVQKETSDDSSDISNEFHNKVDANSTSITNNQTSNTNDSTNSTDSTNTDSSNTDSSNTDSSNTDNSNTSNANADNPSNGGNERFNGMPNLPERSNSESMIMIKQLTLNSGENVAVLLDSVITPVDATVHTIRVQLIYISAILVILSLLMAFIISKRISKSIVKVNASAKELAKGKFDVKFDGKDYKEIAELSDTLNHTASELGKAEGLQRELIANVSHDLRTPLTMITAYSEVMRDLPGENTPENVQVVIDEAKRLTLLVNDLLDISKLQAGVTTLEIKEYNLTEAIKTIIDRYAKLVEQDGYIVEFIYDEPTFVEADEFKIYQVIYNLINNAINYTGDNKTVIVRQITNGTIVRIEVVDSGEGISDDKIDYVWERYYKGDKSHRRAVMGTGLGLSIVKNILKQHNANYGVKSQIGKGTTFWFELKVKADKHMVEPSDTK